MIHHTKAALSRAKISFAFPRLPAVGSVNAVLDLVTIFNPFGLPL
jgi:hypothetical protein